MAAPRIAPEVCPGQFVHIKIPHLKEALLRRPFSVYQADGDRLSVLYKDIGRGTHAMSSVRRGDSVNIIGPLGTPYPIHQDGGFPVLVAGGYGMAALYLVAQNQPTKGIAFFGGATAIDILCVSEFEALGWDVCVSTENGEVGTKGMVTNTLDGWLADEGARKTLEFFACGPNAMLRAVAHRAVRFNAIAWISMDRNMGCGVGACLTCVQKVKGQDGADWKWARVCTEGPVFECREIVWDDE